MRIAQYCPLNLSAVGGMQVHAQCLARELQALGDEVHLVCARPGSDPALTFIGKGAFRPGDYDLVHTHGIHGWRNGAFRGQTAAIVHTLHGTSLAKRLACRRLRAVANPWNYSAIAREALAARCADLVIGIGNHTGDEAARHYRVRRAKIATLPTGHHLQPRDDALVEAMRRRLRLEAGDRVFLFVGRHDDTAKGFHLLLPAFARLRRRHGGLKLVVVPGVDAPTTPGMLSTGFLSLAELSQVYYLADVFVSSALYEGFSAVVVEALSAGIPVVATAIGGTVDAIRDGANGLLVPPTTAGLREGMERALLAPDLCRTLSAQGKVDAADYTWPKVARRARRLYERVLS